MPHLHIQEFKEISFPQSLDGVSFNFVARNAKHSDETLISVSVEEDDFFLLVKQEKGKSLLKSDKLTRPASIYSVHKALLSYAELASLTVISSNVPHRQKNIHLEESSALKSLVLKFIGSFLKSCGLILCALPSRIKLNFVC